MDEGWKSYNLWKNMKLHYSVKGDREWVIVGSHSIYTLSNK
jgi:hypothetical protein